MSRTPSTSHRSSSKSQTVAVTNTSTNTSTNTITNTITKPVDETARLQAIERELPADAVLLQRPQRTEKHAVLRRSSPQQTNLLLAEADESNGDVAGITIDVATARDDLTRAARLRVGVASARRIGQRMADAALTLEAGVAQRVLVAIGALEAKSKSPEGIALVGKVANLRAAARRPRKSSAKSVVTSPAATSAATTSEAANVSSATATLGATRA
jgi:hypothetical protein